MHAILDILTSKLLIATVSVLGCVTLLFSEDDIPSVAFATAVTALLASAIFFPTRRLAFSVYVAWAVTVIVVGTSSAKAQIAGMSLHSFDILFIAADPRAIVFLLRTYLSYALSMLLLLGIAAVVLVLFWRREAATRLRTPARIALVVTMGALSVATMPQWASSRDYYFQGRHASAFAASLRDIRHLFEAHPLGVRIGRTPPQTPYKEAYRCTGAKRPDIVVVHAESQLPPSDIGTWNVPDAVMGDFRSYDGKVHRFGVETFGGNSWVTTASLMSGLSGADFDWMRPFMMKSLNGTVGATVPEIAKSCGYKVDAVIGYDIFEVGSFMTGNGAQDILHGPGYSGPGTFERDSVYFDLGRQQIAKNRASDKPSFLYLETMFTHSPYDGRQVPKAALAGEPFVTDPQTNEYLRRLAIAREDLETFKAQLKQDPGPNGTIVVEYGDHRPVVTLNTSGSNDDLSDWNSPAYETYFAVNFSGVETPPALPTESRVDSAFLGYWIIEAAQIASGGIIDDMALLQRQCDGYFHLCKDQSLVDKALRRRFDSGLLALPALISHWTNDRYNRAATKPSGG